MAADRSNFYYFVAFTRATGKIVVLAECYAIELDIDDEDSQLNLFLDRRGVDPDCFSFAKLWVI